jgi:thiamine pyrophosphokinase
MLNKPDGVRALLQPDDVIIAADGGANYCHELGLQPDVLIGDFDSIQPELLLELEQSGCEIIPYPTHKDFTDLELALRLAQERGLDEAIVFGGAGSRLDQTLANLLLPALPELSRLRVRLVDGEQEVFLLREREEIQVRGQPGDTVSLIPLAGEAEGISTQGLEYPLDGESLTFGSTRGISNVLQREPGRVGLEKGLLLCVVIHAAG